MSTVTDLFDYELTVGSTPWMLDFGSPAIEDPNLVITADDVARRETTLAGSWVASLTVTPIVPTTVEAESIALGIGPLTQAIFSPYCPGFYSDGIVGGAFSLGSVKFGNAPSIFAFGTLHHFLTHVPGELVHIFLYAKASASTLAAYIVYNGVTYASGFVAVTPSSWAKVQIYSGQSGIHPNNVPQSLVGPVTFTDGLTDAAVDTLYGLGPALPPTGPDTPTLLAPPDLNVERLASPIFSWTPVEGAESYELEVALDTEFTLGLIQYATAETTLQRPVAFGQTYYWRVRALASGEASDFSSVWSFFSQPAIPGPELGHDVKGRARMTTQFKEST